MYFADNVVEDSMMMRTILSSNNTDRFCQFMTKIINMDIGLILNSLLEKQLIHPSLFKQ